MADLADFYRQLPHIGFQSGGGRRNGVNPGFEEREAKCAGRPKASFLWNCMYSFQKLFAQVCALTGREVDQIRLPESKFEEKGRWGAGVSACQGERSSTYDAVSRLRWRFSRRLRGDTPSRRRTW